MNVRFDHTHIIHRGLDAAVKFYQEVLGAKILDRSERLGAPNYKLEIGGGIFSVRGVRTAELPMPPGAQPRLGVDHLGFYMEKGSYESAVRRLREKGVRIIEEEDLPAARILYFYGPDGVVIELMEPK
ncbi:MAG: VOC family protein [Candidatus Tectomicrobia bacterium]|nr:VOC family protein [Candidatus Tectomicrobia bacterium]